jgi:hypothetical protein
VRALEVIELSGRPFSATLPDYEQVRPAVQLGLTLPRPDLDLRIAARVDRMWQAGLAAEVAGLVRQGLREGRTASRALGYQQVLRHLDGEYTLAAAHAETIKATRRFARRQESWFRRDPRIHWLDATGSEEHLLTAALAEVGERLRLLPLLGGRGGAYPGERLGGKDHLDRDLEVRGDLQREVQARAVLAALQVANRLVVHAERVGQFAPGDPALGPQHGDPVIDGLAHRRITFSRRAATVEPDSRRAIRRSTTGASTRPATAHADSTPNVARCRHECPTSTAASAFGRRAERIPSPSQ